jgi:Sulfotransferase domain
MSVRARVPSAVQPAARAALVIFGRATSRWRRYPSFVIIGGQRCGTTTLFKALAAHPQVRRPPVDKGTDYYSLYYARGMSWYRSRMPFVPSGAPPRQAFEACTYYMFHPLAVERIAKDFPELKLVALLRDPVTRAYSAYKHEYARGFETESDFRRALELEDARLAGEVDRIRADSTYESIPHRHHAYRRRGQYAEQIARVFEHFPRSQVHIMDSEAFFAEPSAEYRRLIDFLGLERWEPGSFAAQNVRPGSPMPDDAREFLVEHYRSHDAALAELLGRRLTWQRG